VLRITSSHRVASKYLVHKRFLKRYKHDVSRVWMQTTATKFSLKMADTRDESMEADADLFCTALQTSLLSTFNELAPARCVNRTRPQGTLSCPKRRVPQRLTGA